MLCLQVDTPLNRILEFFAGFLQQFHRLRVSHSAKIGVHNIVQAFKQSFFHELVEKLHLFRCMLQNIVDDVFDHSLCQLHVILEVCKSDFRLNHPELRRMSCSIGVLGSESRPEGVHVSKRQGKSLRFQLSAYGQASFLAEEVFTVVDLALFCSWRILHIQGGDSKHLSSAFTVAARYDRRVDIDKVVILEELVNSIRYQRSDSEDSREGIAPRSQVCDLSHELHGMSFLLQWIICRRIRFYDDLRSFDLERLLCLRRQSDSSANHQS